MTEQEEFEFRDRLEREKVSSAPIDRTQFQSPQWQGGALSPQNIQAQQAVKQAQDKVNNLDPAIGTVGAAYNASWPMSALAMQAMGNKGNGNTLGIPNQNIPQATTGGGAALQDIGMMANPLTGMAINAGIKGVGAVGNAISRVPNFVKGLINGPEQAYQASQIAKTAVAKQAAEQIENTQRIGGMKVDIAQQNNDAVQKGYEGLTDILKKRVSQYSNAEAKQLQSDLPKVFGQKSAEYGAAKDAIINNLPEEKQIILTDKVLAPIEEALKKYGILRTEPGGAVVNARAPLTPAENQLFNMYNEQKKFRTINVSDLIKTQKYLEPQYGKQFSPDDKLMSDVSRGINSVISEHIPEIKQLNKSYAPFLEWKNQIIKDSNPFGGQYDTQKSATLLSKVGTPARISGSGTIRPDEAALVSQLETIIGRKVGGGRITSLNKGIVQTGEKSTQASQLAKQTIENLKNNIANDIENIKQNHNLSLQQIDAETTKLVNKYKMQRILVGAGLGGASLASGGKLLEYFIRREAYSGLHGRY